MIEAHNIPIYALKRGGMYASSKIWDFVDFSSGQTVWRNMFVSNL